MPNKELLNHEEIIAEINQAREDLDNYINNTAKPEKLWTDKYMFYVEQALAKLKAFDQAELLSNQNLNESITKTSVEALLKRVNHKLSILAVTENKTTKKQQAALRKMKRELTAKMETKLSGEASSKAPRLKHPSAALLESRSVELLELTTLVTKYFKDTLGIPVELIPTSQSDFIISIPKFAQLTDEEFNQTMSKLGGPIPEEDPKPNQKDREVKEKTCNDLLKLIQDELDLDASVYPCKNGYQLCIYDSTFFESTFAEQNDNITKKDIETDVDESNVVLDAKYIWVFAILDEQSDVLAEDIYSLEEAIGQFVDQEPNAVFIVAYPYVDPNPEDPSVKLVFADNPGPIIIYDVEKPTRTKPKAERERKLGEEEKELERQQEELERQQEELEESVRLEQDRNYRFQKNELFQTVLDISAAYDQNDIERTEQILQQVLRFNKLQELLDVIEELSANSNDTETSNYLEELWTFVADKHYMGKPTSNQDRIQSIINFIEGI